MLSDHADWNELNEAIKATGAERVYVTHGYTAAFARWLSENGIEAHEGRTQYEGELAEINEVTDTSGEENASEESNPTPLSFGEENNIVPPPSDGDRGRSNEEDTISEGGDS